MIIQYWKNAINISNYFVYKDIFTPSYNSTNSKIGTNFLNYAHLKNKEVLIHCYTTQGNNNCPKSFFDEVDNTLIDGVLVYEIVPWTNYDSLINNLISARKTSPNYTINFNTITGVKNNTKVNDFVKNLNIAVTFVVLDYNGNSISKNSYIKDNMTLVMNDKYKYIIKIN